MLRNTLSDYFKRYGKHIEIKKDGSIYNPANQNSASYAYYLDSGIAALMCTTRSGEEKIYLYFNEKKLIGFAQIMVQEAMTPEEVKDNVEFYIIAKTDCVLYRILESDFHHLLYTDLEFNQCILSVLTKNYVEILNRFHQAQEDNTTIRFCRWLLECSIVRDGKRIVPRNFTFVEAAKYLGTHSVTVSRIASDLRKLGCISKEDHYLVIKDESLLKRVIEEEIWTHG